VKTIGRSLPRPVPSTIASSATSRQVSVFSDRIEMRRALLTRPSVPLIGQLPIGTVLTRGANLSGMDMLVKSTAEQSFNQVLVVVIISTALGAVIGAFMSRHKGMTPTTAVIDKVVFQSTSTDEPSVVGIVTDTPGAFCMMCGAKLPDAAAFCPKCGAKRAG